MEFAILFVDTFFNLLSVAIIVRILLSWFRTSPTGPFHTFVVGITEPVLGPIRRMMPRTGMLDFSPLIALIAIDILSALFIRMLLAI